ncbi:MAG: extracellular solute-binding protein [Deltaproteobacteria bacterium]|nr:extracellular solute-binding protein [Deltaproteobacteria bacterium]MBI2209690.1 extracellular solute-binding protein [Deltaproteobacteria bacterium]MBI2540674.1 extracellular solute-binding protein [Deltaproteobacteria bacterium]MBI2991150.1 extracellular solute-binding protein [Deltaproteobacteria bacterium]MBI3060795.1 extracellular solute-binding protein [Deltaproteobacteria bacterium]
MATFVFLVASLAVALISTAEVRAQSGWQKQWEATLAAAEKEGRLEIAGPPGESFRKAIVDAFTKAYPKIKVELLGGSGGSKVARILRERQAGVFAWDLYISGPTSALAGFKPVGAFEPLKPALILPEVREDKNWIGGFDSGWADTEKKLFYAFGGTLAGDNIYVNRDFVSADPIKSARDLLDPKWRGKIVIQDPRVEGKGLTDILVMSLAYGEDFVRKLLGEQKLAVTRDRRQLVEWVVRGRYPIAIGLNEYVLVLFQGKGAGQNIGAVVDPKTIIYWASGSSGIGLFNRAPHPNAAKVYVNWLLSRNGQVEWVETLTNSRRTDVPPAEPKSAMKPGGVYHNVQAEDMIPQRRRIQQLAEEQLR